MKPMRLYGVTTLAVVSSLLLAACACRSAPPAEQVIKLDLQSGYSPKGCLFGHNSVEFSATIDNNGIGEGTFTRDSNSKKLDEYGEVVVTTTVGPSAAKVTLKERANVNKKMERWRLYEITGHGLQGELFLVVPTKGTSPCRLVHASDGGQSSSVVMESTSR